MTDKPKFTAWYWLLAIWVAVLIQGILTRGAPADELSYSEFERALREGRVQEVSVTSNVISGKLKGNPPTDFVTVRVEPELVNHLSQFGVTYSGLIESTFLRDILSWIAPAAIFVGLWALVMRRLASSQGMGGAMLPVGKSKAKIYMESETKVSFADVAGIDEVADELKEVVSFLKEPERYGRLGGRLPRGVLLVGPPGTGKTLIAKAVAGEAGVPFFSINGSEFVEMFVGVGAARVRDLFEQASKHAPCIIFIDELDALGKSRAGNFAGGHDEKEQTLNQLLVELDGFDPRVGIIVLAATNRPEVLDPALLRAGRFDRQIMVDKPDKRGRREILDVHLKRVKVSPSVSPDELAGMTTGFSGADLANLVNEAALLATRRRANEVALQDFVQAIERLVAGLEKKNRILSPREREVVAYHEAGHALTSILTPGSDAIVKISIVPRGMGALGYLMQQPLEDRYLMLVREIEDKLKVLFGGRAAEEIVFKEVSTGGANDLSRATEMARFMVTKYGMGSQVGLATYEGESSLFLSEGGQAQRVTVPHSEQTSRLIDEEVREILRRNYDATSELLRRHRSSLEAVAKALLERETLSAEDVRDILESETGFVESIAGSPVH